MYMARGVNYGFTMEEKHEIDARVYENSYWLCMSMLVLGFFTTSLAVLLLDMTKIILTRRLKKIQKLVKNLKYKNNLSSSK